MKRALAVFSAVGILLPSAVLACNTIPVNAPNLPAATLSGKAGIVVDFSAKVGGRPLRVDLALDNKLALTGIPRADGNAGRALFELDTTKLADGRYELLASVAYEGGEVQHTVSTIAVDNASPQDSAKGSGRLQFVSPKPGSVVSDTVVVQVVNLGPPNSLVSFFVDDQFRSMTNRDPVQFTWNTLKEKEGRHVVRVVDMAGNAYEAVYIVRNQQFTGPGPDIVAPLAVAAPSVSPFSGRPLGTSLQVMAKKGVVRAILSQQALQPFEKPAPAVAATRTVQPDQTKISPVVSQPSGKPVSGPKLRGSKSLPSATAEVSQAVQVPKSVGAEPSVSPVSKKPVVAIAPRNTITPPVVKMAKLEPAAVAPKHAADAVPRKAMTIVLDGKEITFDVQPKIFKGVGVAAFRHLFEAAGGSVDWKSLEKVVLAKKGSVKVQFRIGENVAYVNGMKVNLAVPSFIERNRSMAPISLIRDSLQFELEFDVATRSWTLTSLK